MRKVVVDIGGTKTLISLMDDGRIVRLMKYTTPRERDELLRILSDSFQYTDVTDRLNVAIAGRYDGNRVLISPNIPLSGFRLGRFFSPFEKVNIENDTVCGAHNLLRKNVKNSLLINWGTGIGGAIIIDGKIYKGSGMAGEIGHLRLIEGDWEDRIGGKAFKKRFGMEGEILQKNALMGDRKAIEALERVGSEFGEFIVSMVYLLDPENIYIYGGVIKSWNFMRKSIKNKMDEFSIKKRLIVVRDRYFTLRGCYYLDEF
ncbi:MAG: ROK family protein [Thermoplasmata archaeon]